MPATVATLPQAEVDITMPTVTGNTYTVNSGDNLQTALNSAAAADVSLTHQIVIEAGATFSGNFTVPARSGATGWVLIRTADLANLPAQGYRAKPAHASAMPIINSPDNGAMFTGGNNASRYRFTGIRMHVASAVTLDVFSFVEVRGASTNRIIFDRCLVDNPNNKVIASATLQLHLDHWAIINCTFTNLKGAGLESKAFGSWERTAGPVLVQNNYISAASIGMLLGGGAASQGITVDDVTVRRNHFIKDPAWAPPAGLNTKNHLELKLGKRVLIENNIFENSWSDAQTMALNMSSYDPVLDVTWRYNKLINAYGLIQMNGQVGDGSGQLKRIHIHNNLFDNYDWRGHLIWDTADNVVLDHNTYIGPGIPGGTFIAMGAGDGDKIEVKNNIAQNHGSGGIWTDGDGFGATALNNYTNGQTQDWTSAKNVVIDGNDAEWSTGNFYEADYDPNVGFENFAAGDYRLKSSSPYKNAGTDGLDIGADIAGLNTKLTGVVAGDAETVIQPPLSPAIWIA